MRIVGWTALVLLLGFGFLVSHGFYKPEITSDSIWSEDVTISTHSQHTATQDAATEYATDGDSSSLRDFIANLFRQHVTKEKEKSTEAQSGLGSSIDFAPSVPDVYSREPNSGFIEKAGDRKGSTPRPPMAQSMGKAETALDGLVVYSNPTLAAPAVQSSPYQVPAFQVPPFQVPDVQFRFQVPVVPTVQVPPVPTCCVAP